MKAATLCFLIAENKILLAMKKRGFGVGKWNGTGGKIQENETAREAAVRETKEEIKVSVSSKHLESVGDIKFRFKNNPGLDMRVYVFLARNWKGDPEETEEMRPKWHDFTEIPYDEMWIDDTFWLPRVLNGKKIEAEFFFNETGSKIENYQLRET